MVKQVRQIEWTNQAKKSLKAVYNFHKKVSIIWAEKVRNEIYSTPSSLYFSKQYQIDEHNSNYRKITVGDYKILYIEKNDIVYITEIICSLSNPKGKDND